jgi:dipeptidyl aminopeptidase/acylaminoacyl peptidase
MTQLADSTYHRGGPIDGRAALFSPDMRYFVVVVRRGNLERNTNDFSLLLYQTDRVFQSQVPQRILTLCSSSNREAISKIRWLHDNRTLVFVGEYPNSPAQIYSFDIIKRVLQNLTRHRSAILDFDISSDGATLFYAAEPTQCATKAFTDRTAIVVKEQSLAQIVGGKCANLTWPASKELFIKRKGRQSLGISIGNASFYDGPLSLSPDTKYALVGVNVRDVPSGWARYQDDRIQAYVHAGHRNGLPSVYFSKYLVVETRSRSSFDLIGDAAMVGFTPTIWSTHGDAVFLRTYLPLDGVSANERAVREIDPFRVQVKVPSGAINKIGDDEWPTETAPRPALKVTLEEDSNTPPRVYISDWADGRKTLLLDLNPQFANLQFGKVETIVWRARDGHEVEGGLYFPPDYHMDAPHPLIIQTHGFNGKRFWIDGPFSSAYAAQPLAAKGFFVLQMGRPKNNGSNVENSPLEGPATMSEIEGAIDYLDGRKLIDRTQVGISGFSRSVYQVAYTLTHSEYPFAAAVLVDGIDGGYFQYLAIGGPDYVLLNGAPPFGNSLQTWLRNSPGFNLDRVHTPVQLLAFGGETTGVLEGWEWYVGLRLQNKPVDFIYFPDAPHILVKPHERMAAQQDIVDWFNYWIRHEEERGSKNQERVARWRALRK